MPQVNNEVWINAPMEKVIAIARDTEKYPEYMSEVKSIKMVEKSEDGVRSVAEWIGFIKQFHLTIKWTQEEVWDEAAKTNRFKQLQGDYDSMEGAWQFTEENGGTKVVSTVDYVYIVPMLGALVQKVIFNLVKANLQGSLEAIKTRAEE